MKLLNDLHYVLERQDCDKCEFCILCDKGINGTYNENGDDYNLCEVLSMAKECIEKNDL